MASAHSWRVVRSKFYPSWILGKRLRCAGCGSLLLFILGLFYCPMQQRILASSIQKLSLGVMNAKNSDDSAPHKLGEAGMVDGNVLPDQCRKGNGSEFHNKTEAKYDLMKEGPFHFLPDFRNPCWKHPERGKLQCLPYYYLAGFPKCGTTDMYHRITAHPYVLYARKEPHWITKQRLKGISMEKYTKRYTKPLENLSAKERIHYVLGDGSVSLAWYNYQWRLAPGNEGCSEPRVLNADYLRHLLPTAKVLFMLRNPTDRLYSEYLFLHSSQNKSQEIFHTKVRESVDKFNICLSQHTIRTCVYTHFKKPLGIHVGLYSVFIEDWLLRFPREQLMFVRLEDVHDGAPVLPSIYKFLELEPVDKSILQSIGKIGMQNVGTVKMQIGPMWTQTRGLLDAFYRPFNNRLAHVLQDRRYAWENENVVV